jgi:hypothetical protein
MDSLIFTTVKRALKEISRGILKIIPSKIAVTSNPVGVEVFLDGTYSGITPYRSDTIKSGIHRVQLNLATYEPIDTSVDLLPAQPNEFLFVFLHTKRYIDSVKTADSLRIAVADSLRIAAEIAKELEVKKQARKISKRYRTIKLVCRILSGALTAGAVAGGIYMDTRVQDFMGQKRDSYSKYQSSTNLEQLNKNKQDYDNAHEQGQNYVLYRNFLYISGVVTVACFGVTFFF